MDGGIPEDDDTDVSMKNTTASESTKIEGMPNIVGLKGMRGIENYLRAQSGQPYATKDIVHKTTPNKLDSDPSTEAQMSTSYAETVFALLNSPQPDIVSTVNKENCEKLSNKQNPEISSKKECKMTRKRSLTEMIGHNPLSKERTERLFSPLGEKRCFETDL